MNQQDSLNRIVTLMEEKNHYLEKFYSINERELDNFSMGQFDNIDSFYQQREKILEIISYIDGQIHESQTETADLRSAPENIKSNMKAALRIKDEYVNRIIDQDLRVLACIELAKSSLIKELQEVKKGKKAIGGYKSPNFTQRLDEEV